MKVDKEEGGLDLGP